MRTFFDLANGREVEVAGHEWESGDIDNAPGFGYVTAKDLETGEDIELSDADEERLRLLADECELNDSPE